MLRKGETENVPLRAATVPIIVVTASGELLTDHCITGKRTLVLKAMREDLNLYAVWPGRWSTDVFELDAVLAYEQIARKEA